METPVVKVALIGAGHVGSAVAALLQDDNRVDMLVDAAGARLELVAVAVRDATKSRPAIPTALITNDAQSLAESDAVDILVEVAGGVDPTRSFIESALRRGTTVVTANKALMASDGTELVRLAQKHRTDLFYEGAVAGGIPILRALRTSLAGTS